MGLFLFFGLKERRTEMKKPNVTKMFKALQSGVSKHSPEILMVIGIGGMISATVMAVKATPKAMQLIEEEKKAQNRSLIKEAEEYGYDSCQQISKLKPLEVVKVAWKPYVPTVVTAVASAACLIGSNSVHAKRNAALVTAYKLSETALREFKEAVVETVDEGTVKEIREKVAEKELEKKPISKQEIIITGNGDVTCFDVLSGRYFKSNKNLIDAAVNKINGELYCYDYVSLNEFYDELGLDRIDIGNELGWNIGEIGKGGFDIEFTSHITDMGVPCLVLNYGAKPRYDFAKLM